MTRRAEVKWIALTGIALILMAAALGVYAITMRSALKSPARRAWKDGAISSISSQIQKTETLKAAVAKLNPPTGSSEQRADWMEDGLVVMQNGDWLACRNVCSKEKQHIRDLFIARGSDGKWYYSTYHFCIGMLVLRMDGQPKSLSKFVQNYSLKEFDGQSDKCLGTTWPETSK